MRHLRNVAFVLLCLSAVYAHGTALRAFDCTEVPGPVGVGATEELAIYDCMLNAYNNCDSYCYNNCATYYFSDYDCSDTWEGGGGWSAAGWCNCLPPQ